MKDDTMGNQPATAFEFGWLIGAIDGEGALGITRRNRQEASKGFTLKPHIQVCNCDPSFIARYELILRKLGIPFHVSNYAGKGRRRAHKQVAISGLKRVMKLLPTITPYLCDEKKEKAELILEFCQSRLNDWHAAPFTDRQLFLFERVAELNVKGRKALSVRDYTRSSRSSKFPGRDEDIVQTTTEL